MVLPPTAKASASENAPSADSVAVANELNPLATQVQESKASADEPTEPTTSAKPSTSPSEEEEVKLAPTDESMEISNNLKLPSLPSSSSSASEDIYDLFSPPVNTNVRSKPRNMTVVTAADSVLKDEEGVVLPPFRDQVS